LLLPRILSRVSEAPYLGEAATLFALTRRSLEPLRGDSKIRLPAAAGVGIGILLAIGIYEIAASLRKLTRRRRNDPRRYTPAPGVQLTIWLSLLACAVLASVAFGAAGGFVFLLAALILPWQRRTPAGSPAYNTRKHTRSEP